MIFVEALAVIFMGLLTVFMTALFGAPAIDKAIKRRDHRRRMGRRRPWSRRRPPPEHREPDAG